MRKRLSITCAVFALAFAAALSQQAQEKQTAGTLQVKVNYSGSGVVDATHKIYVALWDSPGFAQGQGIPVAVLGTDSKNGTVTFSEVAKTPAYLSVAYDPTGKWDAKSAPPAGSSLALYGKNGTPEPINVAPGQTVKVEISLDDSVKAK